MGIPSSSTIVSGSTSASITLTPVNDTTNETSETVIITASTTDVSTTGNTQTTITIYDYVYRAMPYGVAQSLSYDETYEIVAYLLYMSDIIEEDFVLSDKNIGEIEMPNRDGFLLPDPRPDVKNLNGNPCMKNCNTSTNIIGKARDIDVTPEDEKS